MLKKIMALCFGGIELEKMSKTLADFETES